MAGREDRLAGDEGGHVIASIFDGPGEMVNLYPQNGNFNKGGWKQLKNSWAAALESGKKVEVKIELKYAGDGVRPDKLQVEYRVDGGRPIYERYDNAPGGRHD